MKPAPFAYEAPESLPVALDLLARYGDEAKILAGGQSLIPVLNFRLSQPARLIDLNRIDGLSEIACGADGGLSIGAMTRQRAVERSPLVAEVAPLLAEAVPWIAHPQIRNRGTIGGSLAHADPAAELPALAVALDARFRLAKSGGERWVAARDFYTGLFATLLDPDELLVEISIPPAAPKTGFSFMEVARRHGDYAQVGLAASVTLEEDGRCRAARLTFLSVGDRPIEARAAAALLAGQTLSPEAIATCAAAVGSEINPFSDVHATAEFKRHLAQVLTRRGLALAAQRAGLVA
ncbi:MAG TPA: xanthine dehydrogenase family protein subunit M [Thermoanaerobaculia bacterium]|jgi:carbon-monoxide dehydrogenase medium subunit|nr:xanthine dehydrogenase family protein subunit M [Thermoanaerobaculia bacterium]